jgi:CheY-like chemotaxis protein
VINENGNDNPAVESFRLLVVDDEEEIQTHVRDLFRDDPEVQVISAFTQAEALSAIDEYCLDTAIVDIELDTPAAGYDVLRKFAHSSPDTPVIVYTKYVDPAHVRDLLDLINTTPPRVTKVIDKAPMGSGAFEPARLRLSLAEVLDDWRRRRVELEHMDLALRLLHRRRKRIEGYRERPQEVAAELDRICRKLFGKVRGLAERSGTRIQLNPLGAEGLSSAITVEAKVILGEDVAGNPVTGSRCVLKIGPAQDIREEVERYSQFVKYGVRLKQRVEMLGHTYQHSLGAVCYSFAGGVFGSELLSLSQLLEDPEQQDLARESISALFDVSSQNWYAVRCDKQSSLSYVAETYGTNFTYCYQRLDESLSKLRNSLRQPELQERLGGFIDYTKAEEDRDGTFEVGGQKLSIPRMNILGGGKFVAPIPACLVHGDMHGSNVMLELEGAAAEADARGHLRRVCLIDYRSAGPGPRATDIIALQASLRLADSKDILVGVSGDADASKLTREQCADGVRIAVARQSAELRLLHAIEGPGDQDLIDNPHIAHWELMDAEITTAMQKNFIDMHLLEYLSAALPLTLRYFCFSLDPIARVRMLAWVSAQLQILRQATSDLQVAPRG